MASKSSYAKKPNEKGPSGKVLKYLPRIDRQPKKGRHIFPNGIRPSTIDWMPWE